MVRHSFIPRPAEIIAIANGMMFGLAGGILVTWFGAMLGALLAFGLARALGRPALKRLLSEPQWRTVNRWEWQPGSLLLARLIPVLSFNVINYAAGLARVRFWRFLWTTSIGILPLTVLSVAFGDAALGAGLELIAFTIAGAAVVWLVARRLRGHDIASRIFVRRIDLPESEERPSVDEQAAARGRSP